MKKWYDEEYAFTVEVTGFLRVIIRSIIAAAAAIWRISAAAGHM